MCNYTKPKLLSSCMVNREQNEVAAVSSRPSVYLPYRVEENIVSIIAARNREQNEVAAVSSRFASVYLPHRVEENIFLLLQLLTMYTI